MAEISTYRIYGPWAPGPSWADLSTTYTWAQLADRFTWADLTIGEVNPEDIESIRIERRMSDIFNRHRIAKAHVILDNHSGNFSPDVNSSMRPNRPIAIHAELDTGSVFPQFTGIIETIQLDPRLGARKISLECSDNSIKLKHKIELTTQEDINVGSLYIDAAKSAGIPRGKIIVDAIKEEAPVAFIDEMPASDAFEILKRTSATVMYPDGRGRLLVRDRNYDVGLSSVSSHGTDGEFFSFQYKMDTERVVNVARIIGEKRRSTEISTVAWIDQPIEIASGESASFNLLYVDPITLEDRTPVNSLITPVESSDYNFNIAVGDGTDVSSNLTVDILPLALSAHVTVTNNGPGGFLSKFQIRGVPLQKQPPIESVSVNSNSMISYDAREMEIESSMYPSNLYAKNYGEWLVDVNGEPNPEVSWSIKNEGSHVVHHDLSDIITLVNTLTGINSAYQIIGITQHILFTKKGIEHRTIFDSRLLRAKSYLILDDATLGQLDSDRVLGF